MIVVYDLEQFANFHSCYAKDINTGEEFYFELSPYRDDRSEYFNWLTKVKGMVGFNNLNYDYPLLYFFICNVKKIKPLDVLIKEMYRESSRIINNKFAQVSNELIKQCDLFAICHFNNDAKRTSLKDLQIAMNWPNVQDLPYRHDSNITEEQAKEIKKYNRNDVLSTYEFYKKIHGKIELRKELSKEYNIDALNWDDSKIGEQILIKEVCKKKNVQPWEIKSTYSGETIAVKDCYVNYEIQNKETQEQKDYFSKLRLTNEEFKGQIITRKVIKEFPFDFGAGGIHGCVSSQYVIPKEDEMIKSSDVSSYYPNLAIVFKFYMRHIGEEYIDVVKELYEKKQTAKKFGLKTTLAAVKLALVSIFGKSNDRWSRLFDPKYFLTTTINGQLLLADLHLSLIKEGFIPLLLNTDGVEFLIKRKDEKKYEEICSNWEKKTNLVLEHNEYKRLAILNVNNYIGEFTSGEIKRKGVFEIDKDWHKDPSFRVIRLALEEYFIRNVSPKDFIPNHKEIYDFCGRVKSNSGYSTEFHFLDKDTLKIDYLQKTNRVFISNSGGYIYKTKDFRRNAVYKGQKVKIFNNFYEGEYDINYNWYIKETQKIIDEVEPKQLTLF